MSAVRRVDAVIVGGGPAGLSAALVLGRCRREVVVVDHGHYRNRTAKRVKGFLTRDNTPPEELRQLARTELSSYPSVRILQDAVLEVRRTEDDFVAVTSCAGDLVAPVLLLATGFADTLPPVAGVGDLHGDLVNPCPYCDAWEVRDTPLAAFSHADDRGGRYAALLAQWSNDVVFCADRGPALSEPVRRRLERRGVRVESRRLERVERDGDGLRLVFTDGEPLWRRMLFYHLGGRPASDLAARLGASLDDRGGIEVDRHQQTSVPGLFVAGDASRDVLQAIVAAGEGSAAAVSMNELLSERE